MNQQIPGGLRLAFLITTVVTGLFSVVGLVAPNVVASVSGLPELAPVYQQTSAFGLAAAVMAILAYRASEWREVRITAIGAFVNALLSAIGAFYYVVLQGAISLGLVVILLYTIYATVAFGYYLWGSSRS